MSFQRSLISMGFTDRKFLAGSHICYLFGDDDERLDVIGSFLSAGEEAGDKLLYAVDEDDPARLTGELISRGVGLHGRTGQLAVSGAESTYRPSGRFQRADMLQLIREFFVGALEDGFAGARGTGEMSWLARHPEESDEAMMYEAQLTETLAEYPYTAICQYDTRVFGGKTMMDVLNVHPFMIVRGQVVENPFYADPRELAATRPRSDTRAPSAHPS